MFVLDWDKFCLRDIKNLFGQSGNYRYHFKAMDPEFGTVKEEVSKIIPYHKPSSGILNINQPPSGNH